MSISYTSDILYKCEFHFFVKQQQLFDTSNLFYFLREQLQNVFFEGAIFNKCFRQLTKFS